MHDTCVFCSILAGTIPSRILAQDEQVFVLQDIAPKAPVHYLIIPKKHVRDIQSCAQDDHALMASVSSMAQKLSAQLPEGGDFKLLANNGYQAGQRVMHLHFHFLAGKLDLSKIAHL